MKRAVSLPLAVVVVCLAGCLKTMKPVQIHHARGEGAVDHIARALAKEGLIPEKVEPGSGLVITAWRQGGMCLHPKAKKGDTAILSVRHVVVATGEDAVLRLEAQCCLGGSLELGDTLVRGECVARDGVSEGEQADLDALGGRLEAALGTVKT